MLPSAPSGLVRPASDVHLTKARARADQAFVVLSKLVPLAVRVVRLVRAYTVAVAVAAGVILLSAIWIVWPSSLADVAGLGVLVALLCVPIVVLWLFGSALREVVELPSHLGSVPDLAKAHGTELAGLVRTAQARENRTRVRPGDAWRAGRLLLVARRDLPGYGAVLTLVSPAFLLVSLAAALAGVWFIVMAVPTLATALAVAVF